MFLKLLRRFVILCALLSLTAPVCFAEAPPAASETTELEVISAPGRYPFTLPTREGSAARRDPIDVARGGDGRIAVLLRPGDALLETADEGATWTVHQPNLELRAIAPGVETWWGLGELNAEGQAQRVVQSRNGGKEWRTLSTGKVLKPDPHSIVLSGRTLVLATNTHLVWTGNLGGKWRYVNPLIEQPVTAIHQPAGRGDHWWIGGALGGVSRGDSRGRRWKAESLPVEAEIRGFAEGADGALFAATRSGLWRRDAQGVWLEVEVLAERDLHGVLMQPDGWGVAYGAYGRLAVTHDGGLTWRDQTGAARSMLSRSGLAATGRLTWRAAVPVEGGALLFGDEATIVRLKR